VTKLGFTFAAESLGLIMGPVLGGLFSQYGFAVSAYIAAGIALLCLLLTIFFFPETRKDLTPGPFTKREGVPSKVTGEGKFFSSSPFPRREGGRGVRSSASSLLRVILNPRTRGLILMVFIIQLLIMMMWGTLALYGNHLFGFTGKEMGYISAFAALAGIFSQTVLLKGITRIAREKTIIVIALLTMGGAMALIAFSSHVAVMLVGIGLMAGCFNVAMPTVVGLASRHSAESEQGNLMGTTSAMINIGSLVGPVFANAIYSVSMRGSYLSASALGLLAALVAAAQLRNESTLAGEQEESPG
jgi:MFS family permease